MVHVQVTKLSTSHTPDKAQWQRDLQSVHDTLSESATSDAPQPLSSDNSHAALKEFSTHGQMGLDELLDALDGGLEVSRSGSGNLALHCQLAVACFMSVPL